MSNGIYPQYVGPTVQYRHQSLYPRWIKNLIDTVIEVLPEGILSGVLVLPDPLGADIVEATAAVIAQAYRFAASTVQQRLGGIEKPPPGVTVVDEEPGHG